MFSPQIIQTPSKEGPSSRLTRSKKSSSQNKYGVSGRASKNYQSGSQLGIYQEESKDTTDFDQETLIT